MVLVGVKVRWVDQTIVKVNVHEMVKEVSQNAIDHGLKNCWGIGESKRLDSVLIVSVRCVESSLPLISPLDMDQMVNITKIKLSKYFGLL